MHDHRPILQARVRRHLAERIRPAETETVAALTVSSFDVVDPIPVADGIAGDYAPFQVPAEWGPSWGTTWFKVEGVVPEDRRGDELEVVIDLGMADFSPGFQCEALVLREDGSVVKALNPRNRWIPLGEHGVPVAADGSFTCYLEASAVPILLGIPPFEPTERGDVLTCDRDPLYTFERADLVVVHHEVRELIADLETLVSLAASLPENATRRWQVEIAMDKAMDRLVLTDIPGTAAAARAELAEVLAEPAAPHAHQISAIGHAHIDTAWLWPIRETRRKVTRTLANVLGLVESGSGLTFALPAAQHAAWLEEDNPELFARLQKAVAAGDVVPVGGMWVEPDAVLPGGEAMCRQLTYGTRWFRDRLGHRCREVWLPDSFGYSGALPQLARLAGMRWFLTQKISWNQRNKFPHHSFWWEGIDGTRIFTHFPSADTYNSDLSCENLIHAATNFADKGRTDTSLVPFGWGDGGGGPTREMVWQARRVANLDGVPRTTIEAPEVFFERAEADYADEAATWVGELYLELHRGAFTSQAETKAGNRRNEHLLKEAELFAATAAVRGLMEYPYDELEDIWRDVLVGQFHDILPGSSIAWVHRDNVAMHARSSARLETIINTALTALGGDGDAARVSARPVVRAASTAGDTAVTVTREGEDTIVANGLTTMRLDADGHVVSLRDERAGREVIPVGEKGARLQLHQDFPNAWDAWDVDPFYRHHVTNLDAATSVAAGTDGVTVERAFGSSTLTQRLWLEPGDPAVHAELVVDWRETECFLKWGWPLDVHADHAKFETQFGHITRATHTNTPWDDARFEVNAHRWVHVGEHGYGVAIANSRTYGWDITRHRGERGSTFSVVRASLLRGPRFPDPRTDQGTHTFGYLVVPGADLPEAVAAGYAANLPERPVGKACEPLVSVDGGFVVETVKLADDRSGDVVVRGYEALGGRATATLHASFDVASVTEVDLLEEPLDDPAIPRALHGDSSDIRLELNPFQVVTLRLGVRR